MFGFKADWRCPGREFDFGHLFTLPSGETMDICHFCGFDPRWKSESNRQQMGEWAARWELRLFCGPSKSQEELLTIIPLADHPALKCWAPVKGYSCVEYDCSLCAWLDNVIEI
jgi:hypothetical protein